MRRPDLFIIGAPKSGTTSLYEYLGGHPEIYMSPFKEPTYFCPDVRGWRGQPPFEFGADEAAYLALFDADSARDARRMGEASTRYLVSRDAARLVHEFQSDAFAVAMLRNPVELVHALHNERVSQGHEPLTDFAQAMAADMHRSAGVGLPGDANELGAVYRQSGRFAAPLERWFHALGRDRVHVVVFDDLVRDPAAQLNDVLRFMGVSTDFEPPTFNARNASHRQRALVRRALDSRAGTWLTDDVARAVLGTHGRMRFAHRFRQGRLNRRAVPREPIPDLLRKQLEDEFLPDVEATGAMIGRDLATLWFGDRSR